MKVDKTATCAVDGVTQGKSFKTYPGHCTYHIVYYIHIYHIYMYAHMLYYAICPAYRRVNIAAKTRDSVAVS